MKKALAYITSIIIFGSIYSCKNDDKTELNNVSTEEASEIVASSLSSDNGGTTTQFNDAISFSEQIYDGTKGIKGETFDTTITLTNRPGARITFEYVVHYEYGLSYNNTLRQFELIMNYDTDGNIKSPRIESSETSNGNISLTGIEPINDYYKVSGTVSKEGTYTTSIKDKKSLTCSINLTFSDILIKKSDNTIESGTGTITINGKNTDGESFSFTGTLEYKSDGTIILTINGEEYVIDANSGEIIA